jgi:hypothetical protein
LGALIVSRIKYKHRREFEREMLAKRLRKLTKLAKAKKLLSRGPGAAPAKAYLS